MKKLILFTVLIPFALFYCGNEPISGNSSQDGNPAIAGTLHNPDGSLAKGAKVRLVPVDNLPSIGKILAVTDSTTTDSNGVYGFDSLPADTYNIFGEGTTGNLSYQDSVAVTGDSLDIPPDTLDLPGSMAGFIKMEPGDDPRTVTMYVIGATKYALPEADASFSLADMARGAYRVRILSILDKYLPLDTVFTIQSGTNFNLPDSIILPLKIPKITGFKIAYDTLKQIVTLTWNKADTSLVKGYNVYRQHLDSAEVKLNAQPLLNALYVDSTGVQDQTYIYGVVGVDATNKEGTRTTGDTVLIEPTFTLIDSIGNGLFQGYQIFKIAPSGKLYVADISGNSWKIYVFDTNLVLIKTIASIAIKYPASFDLDSSSNIYAVNQDGIFKLDSSGLLADTLSTWHNAENKTLRLYKGSIFVTSGNLMKFSTDGTLLDSTNLIGTDGLIIRKDTVIVGGGGTSLRLFDTSLVAIGTWQSAFKENEIAWSLAKDEQNNTFILGYHSNPNVFTLLYYDQNQNYEGKMSLTSLSKHIDVRDRKLFLSSLTATGKIMVYHVW